MNLLVPIPEFDSVVIARAIFWALLPVVLFGPRKWAVIAWLLMANLDATGPSKMVNSHIGWINVVKNLGLPVFLLFRLRMARSSVWRSLPAVCWGLLVAYASVAALWSAFPLAAAKIVANMAGILLVVIVLERSARLGLLDARSLPVFICGSLALALLQTYLLGGKTYGFDGSDQAVRLTSFVGAQQFAALLVAFLAMALWMRPMKPAWRGLLVMALLGGVLLNGSRTWFAGAFVVLSIYTWIEIRKVLGPLVLAGAGALLILLLAANFGLLNSDRYWNTNSRLIATLNAVLTGQDTPGRAGLRNLSFRTRIYMGMYDDLSSSKLPQVVLGHGTSNGGAVAATILRRGYRVDPNRAVHNEWFRVQYEWGIVGLLFWGMASLGIVVAAIQNYKLVPENRMSAALLAYLPGMGLALVTENIFAGAGSAVTIGFSVLLVCAFYSPVASESRSTEPDGSIGEPYTGATVYA